MNSTATSSCRTGKSNFRFQQAVDRKAQRRCQRRSLSPKRTSGSIRFSFVGISAARTTIEWSKPIAHSPHSLPEERGSGLTRMPGNANAWRGRNNA